MKKESIILITAGIMIAALLFTRKKTVIADYIQPGDKGNDVAGLQSALSAIGGKKIGNVGAYDNNTLFAVQNLLKGSSALIDYDKGYVNSKFAYDLYLIQRNAKTS